ncbi:Ankyrin repeat domain-containing protein 17 [Paragonimus heterotremus]|uniref:Ankyrin repeat domain-containing protein 17 n=1 Tax=Paragonimus heterotremus TaxID=100268 RepID=A0A8J4TG35_9TREM|nr:Ankyrin repeat domain-containing protein 17 [Paragonimus heterotremus]
MGDFSNFKFEDTIPDLSPETQLNFRKFLQVAGIENMLINDGRRISDTEVLNEIRKEVAMLSRSEEERTASLIPACINGDDEAVRSLLPTGDYDVNEIAADGETALTCAVSANALRIVEMLLKHGADPNFRGKKVECTPLMEAASVGYTDIVRLLLEYGAAVDQESSTRNTALHYAATAGHLDCVRLLLQYNAPMEVQNETGHTPLMEATSNGHIDVARCLIEHGCDINTHSTEFKESALTLASYKGHAEMVRFLLEAGADHEHRTDEMHTALMEAAMEGHVEVARLLLAHGANVNIPKESYESPLTLAACGGHTELAHLLIGYGADIEEVNDEGYTPLMEAAREGHEETVALLLAVGADVNARTEETQETALTLAACGGFIEVCEMLLNAGADIEVGGVGCSTPLMEASQEGHLELVRRLLQRGAAVNAVTATGDTALHYAAENGHVKVCKELLDWGAVFGAMTEGGRTPLMKAARSGNLEVVQLFLERGAAIDQPTSQNDANALSLACSGGHAKVVKYLLQHGADPQYQLRDGSTMLIEAARSGSPAVLRLILDYPRCLTQPSTTQFFGNTVPQHLQLLQQQSYQHLQNGSASSVMDPPTMPPPPPPPLPLSITSGTNIETCMDHAHSHLYSHQRAISCHAQHAHQPLSFQTPTPGLIVSANSGQQPTHLDAALVSAYAVGWADGAASLVQQQQLVTLPSGEPQPNVSTAVLCSPATALLTHPSETLILSHASTTFGVTPILNSVPQKSHSTTLITQPLRGPVETSTIESQADSSSVKASFVQISQSGLNTTNVVTCSSSTTTNSVCSSSNSSGDSSVCSRIGASSLPAGNAADASDDIGAGLLQALFQELMPDKEELIRRFEAVICPYNPLRVVRPTLGQQQSSGCSTATAAAVAMTTNAAAVALSRLVDQQQQCRQRSGLPGTANEIRSLRQLIQCPHVSHPDLLSKVVSGETVVNAIGDESLSVSSVQPTTNQRAMDSDELMESVILGSSNSDTTPILSSCHSSSSALSTPECSVSSSLDAMDSVRLPNSVSATALGPSSPITSYEYELGKTSDVLSSTIDSPYLSGVVDAIGFPNAQNIFHEPTLEQEMLTSYRHYHHPNSHLACALDATAAAAAVASLGHPNSHTGLHHQLTVSAGGDGLVTPSGLLHLPQQAPGVTVDALMTNSNGSLAYDPASALAAHAIHPSSLPIGGPRVMPMSPSAVLTSSGTQIPAAHVLNLTDVSDMNGNLHNASVVAEPSTPVNIPSLIDVNACIESSMETALTLACHGGYTELVRLLLERGADREHRDKKSHTPLHTAVYANQRAVVAVLLDYGAEIESQVDRTKDTALSIACCHGMLEIVEELLNRGANKEHRNISDYTPLSLAASSGHVEVIQLLLRHGAEINSRTGSKLGISPLMLASMNGHTNAVRLLLEHGSDINAHIETNRNTALTLACFQGRHAVVSLLVERKANIEHRAKTGLTPLMEAASGDYVEVGMILLHHGADVNAAPVPSSRDTALTIAADKGNAKFVNLLLKKGAIVEARNKKGATPLWLASNGGHLEVVQSLIQYNADVNSQDNRKVSCLMAAFRKGHVNVVRLLVNYVTQFPSDKDCVRHIRTAVTDKYNSSCATANSRLDLSARTIVQSSGFNLLKRIGTGISRFPAHGSVLTLSPSNECGRIPTTLASWSQLTDPDAVEVHHVSPEDANRSQFSLNESNEFVDDEVIMTDDDVASIHSLSKTSTSSGCSVSFDSYSSGFESTRCCCELAKRCQQCREIILTAKEKQEGEARKNANCLLEQIEQEEEERANREAMQARKRERKRMKRRAKQEKERQGKESVHPTSQKDRNSTNGHNVSLTQDAGDDQEDGDDFSCERRGSTLSHAVRHVRKCSRDSQRSTGSVEEEDATSEVLSSVLEAATSSVQPLERDECFGGVDTTSSNNLPTNLSASVYTPLVSHSSKKLNQLYMPVSTATLPVKDTVETPPPSSYSDQSAAAIAEAKREKHRNKKQSQRAAKRAAAETSASTDIEKLSNILSVSSSEDSILRTIPTTSPYYPVTPNGDIEVNWNVILESQGTPFGQYVTSGTTAASGNESNSWTVVLPSSSGRAQRGPTQHRPTTDSLDWKTTSGSSSSKRRFSIPVSRHDIGKVIGQGGAVVSALRNMSGIQIDIESARSDEVTERMVYLKGPSDAVQRTYETIQGLLNGSIAGNDVLLMYAALKKSTTTANPSFGKAVLGALNSRANGAVTSTTPSSNVSKNCNSGTRGTSSNKAIRRAAKSSTSTGLPVPSTTTSTRSSSSQPSVGLSSTRTPGITAKNAVVITCSNNNNNSTAICGLTTIALSIANGTIMSTKVATASSSSWSSKFQTTSSSNKGNFASVAAAGLVPQFNRPNANANAKVNHCVNKHTTVPSLMNSFSSTTPTTAPVSLLSLNVTPFSTASQMFPDLALSFSNFTDTAPDSLDEASFPPLNPKSTRIACVSNTVEEKEAIYTASPTSIASVSDSNSNTSAGTGSREQFTTRFSETDAVCTPSSSQSQENTISEPEVTPCSVPSGLFKPLTVSPPIVVGTQASQPQTPVDSGGSHVTTCASTPPAAATHVRSFARAPGSERSAHQRSAAVSSAATSSLGDTYPPSLMSLDVAVSGIVADTLLLTPTKRAITPELHDANFLQSTLPGHFRTDQSSEWHESTVLPTAVSQSGIPFHKPQGFPLESHTSVELTPTSVASIHQPNMGSITTNLNMNKSSIRSSDSLRPPTLTSSWPLQATDLNPDAAAFEPSAFQPPGSSAALQASIVALQATGNNASAHLAMPPLARPDYSDLSNPGTLAGGYSLDSSLNTGLRQVSSYGPLKPNVVDISLSMQQPGGPPAGLNTSVGSPSMNVLAYTQNPTATTTVRSKPLLHVTSNAYTEPRNPLLNGLSNSIGPSQLHSSSLASMISPGTQFHPMFPSAPQQSTVLGSGNLPSSLLQQHHQLASRLGGNSPHPLLTQPQFTMGPPAVSANSYNSSPCVSGLMQPNAPGSATNPIVSTHPGGSFSTHLLNGGGPSVPVVGSGSLLGNATSMHQSTTIQAVPIQPIGAERRRQTTATLTSTIGAPACVYPASTSNGTCPGPYGFTSAALTNQTSLHPQAPSPQQSSNPNFLMLMNLTAQHSQQQQQQQMGLGATGSSHPSTNWQSHSMWPTNNLTSSFPNPCGGTGLHPSKVSAGGLTDLNAYSNANLVSNNLTPGSGPVNNQSQQQQLVAAMAAMGICPWNNGAAAGSSMLNPVSTASMTTNQSRWMYPMQGASGYPGTNASAQAFFQDQLPLSLKPASGASHSSQSVHRPTHE